MLKLAVPLLLLVAVVAADIDPLHAHCDLRVNFDKDCGSVRSILEEQGRKGLDDPKAGTYELVDTAREKIHFTRTTASKKYTDDIVVTFPDMGKNSAFCTAIVESKSRALSFYDFNTNYCNIHNLFLAAGVPAKSKECLNCWWKPKDDAECAKH